MDAPKNNPNWWRPRADLIRECVELGLPTREIKARCLAEGYTADDASFRQAVYSARKSEGYPIASRPSYYGLWKMYLIAYEEAYRSGKVIGHTREMQNLIDEATRCVTQDQIREPITDRRARKKKRK